MNERVAQAPLGIVGASLGLYALWFRKSLDERGKVEAANPDGLPGEMKHAPPLAAAAE